MSWTREERRSCREPGVGEGRAGEGQGGKPAADGAQAPGLSTEQASAFTSCLFPTPTSFSCSSCAAFPKLPPQHLRKDFVNILEVTASY